MTPTLPESPLRRRNEQIIGVLLAVLGLVVLAVAIIALQHPKGHQATAAPATTSSAAAASSPKTTPSTKPATSQPATSPSTAPTTAVSSTAASTPATTTASTTVAKQPLLVLNNTDITGLADTAKTRFEAGGWTVTGTGNLVNDIISTCAYYDPNVPGAQAAAAALQAQFPAIKRIEPKFDGLPAGPIVVVLTTDYS